MFINIFGGITRCDLVAQGILEALARVEATVPIVVRLDGTNAEEGRRILAEAAHPRIVPATTMLEAAERAAALAKGDGGMSVLVGADTQLWSCRASPATRGRSTRSVTAPTGRRSSPV